MESLEEIAELMAQNGASFRTQTPMHTEYIDLGNNLDDRDSSYWEERLGGPDDVDFEALEIEYDSREYDEPFDYEDDSVAYDSDVADDCEIEEANDGHKKLILDWLLSSNVVQHFSSGQGFLVPRGPHVKLEDGSVSDLIDWLVAQGFSSGSCVAGYSVARTRHGIEFEEGLSFSRIVVNSPLNEVHHSSAAVNTALIEEDIPF